MPIIPRPRKKPLLCTGVVSAGGFLSVLCRHTPPFSLCKDKWAYPIDTWLFKHLVLDHPDHSRGLSVVFCLILSSVTKMVKCSRPSISNVFSVLLFYIKEFLTQVGNQCSLFSE